MTLPTRLLLALLIVPLFVLHGLLAGCLRESSRTCRSGGVCPPGLQCADINDEWICIPYDFDPSELEVQATPATLSFTATIDAPLPSTQSLQATFNGVDVKLVSAPAWLTVSLPPSPVTSPAVIDLSVNSTDFPPGTMLSGNVVLLTPRGALTRTTTVRVTYDLVAAPPEVQFVAPYVGVAGRAGALILRGRHFQSKAGPATVGLGALALAPISPDHDTQITASYPPLPAGRYPVTVNPEDNHLTSAELVLIEPPAFGYQAIDAPSRRRRLLYDAERQALYAVSRVDQQIERFAYQGGAWSALPPRVIPQLNDLALGPNGRALFAITSDSIHELALTDELFAPVRRASIPNRHCGDIFDHAVPTNHGKLFVVVSLTLCSGSGSAYLYDLQTHGVSTTASFYEGLAAASADGSRIYVGSDGLSPPPRVHFFDSLSGSTFESNVHFNLHAASVSADASRVVLQNRFVYNRALALLGHVPDHGQILVSRDASRAFLYAEDGAGPRIEVYDLNGPLQPGALFPLLKTVTIPDAANGDGSDHPPVAMTSSLDDATVFIAGDRRLLIVPVN